jgi:hypothetical protein
MTIEERDYLLTVHSGPVMLLLVANIQLGGSKGGSL